MFPQNKAWSFKPQVGARVNLGHPLAQQMRGCWLFNTDATIEPNILGTDIAAAVNNACSWTINSAGPMLTCNALGSYYVTGFYNHPLQSGTVHWLGIPNFTATDGNRHYFWGVAATISANNELALQRYIDGNFYVGWTYVGRADTRVVVTSTSSNLDPTNVQSYTFVWDTSASRFYRNGLLLGQTLSAPNSDASVLSQPMGINCEQNGNTNTFMPAGGGTNLFAIWGRALSQSEIIVLAGQPYSFLARPAGYSTTALSLLPDGTPIPLGSLSAPFLFFDTGDYSSGV